MMKNRLQLYSEFVLHFITSAFLFLDVFLFIKRNEYLFAIYLIAIFVFFIFMFRYKNFYRLIRLLVLICITYAFTCMYVYETYQVSPTMDICLRVPYTLILVLAFILIARTISIKHKQQDKK